MPKKKRQINLKAIEGAIKSDKTPAHLKAGLIKKYGKELGLNPVDKKITFWLYDGDEVLTGIRLPASITDSEAKQKAIESHDKIPLSMGTGYTPSEWRYKLEGATVKRGNPVDIKALIGKAGKVYGKVKKVAGKAIGAAKSIGARISKAHDDAVAKSKRGPSIADMKRSSEGIVKIAKMKKKIQKEIARKKRNPVKGEIKNILIALNSSGGLGKYPIGNKALTEKVKELEAANLITYDKLYGAWKEAKKRNPVKKHSCDRCATDTQIMDDKDYPWANDSSRPYVVYAQHIHSGKITPSVSFDSLERAERYRADMNNRCTSHRNFFIIKKDFNNKNKPHKSGLNKDDYKALIESLPTVVKGSQWDGWEISVRRDPRRNWIFLTGVHDGELYSSELSAKELWAMPPLMYRKAMIEALKQRFRNPAIAEKDALWYVGVAHKKDNTVVFPSRQSPNKSAFGDVYKKVYGPFVTEIEARDFAKIEGKQLLNPQDAPVEIYDNITAIEAVKGAGSKWAGKPFRHSFKVRGVGKAKIYGLKDGSLLIKGNKRLWKDFQYPA